jgi:hypothetical protein
MTYVGGALIASEVHRSSIPFRNQGSHVVSMSIFSALLIRISDCHIRVGRVRRWVGCGEQLRGKQRRRRAHRLRIDSCVKSLPSASPADFPGLFAVNPRRCFSHRLCLPASTPKKSSRRASVQLLTHESRIRGGVGSDQCSSAVSGGLRVSREANLGELVESLAVRRSRDVHQ